MLSSDQNLNIALLWNQIDCLEGNYFKLLYYKPDFVYAQVGVLQEECLKFSWYLSKGVNVILNYFYINLITAKLSVNVYNCHCASLDCSISSKTFLVVTNLGNYF